MRISIVVITMLMSALLVVPASSSAQGNGAQVDFVPLSSWLPVVYNPCTGEDMYTSGSLKIVSRISVDPTGREHFIRNVSSLNASAVGAVSGLVYRGHAIFPNWHYNVSADGTGNYLEAVRFGWVSPTEEMNWFSTFVLKFVVNANGDQIIGEFTSVEECR